MPQYSRPLEIEARSQSDDLGVRIEEDEMHRWNELDCLACGSADVDLSPAVPGPLFACQECGERVDPSADKPPCPLVGTDGNVFAIIGAVSRCLRRAGRPGEAKAWVAAATASTSYDEVLQKTFAYVDLM